MQNTNEMMKSIMEEDIKKWDAVSPEVAKKARACMKHFKCLGCLDTNRVLHTTDGYWYGIYYDEYTCGACTSGHDYIKRHSELKDAVGTNKRQIPCNDSNPKSIYSHTGNLASIYAIEFEALDKVKMDSLGLKKV